MRYSISRSIARSLPVGEIGRTYSPDGLDEAAIDALIDQAYAEAIDAPTPMSVLSTGSAEQQRIRRQGLQVVRSLPGVVASRSASVAPNAGEAA